MIGIMVIIILVLGCVSVGSAETALSDPGSTDSFPKELILLYRPYEPAVWKTEKRRALGVSTDGKRLLRTESGNQLWKFGLKSGGKLTIRLEAYMEEPFDGICLFLLDEDQRIVHAASADGLLSEEPAAVWELSPGMYYIDLMFPNTGAVYQGVMIRLFFDGEAENIPMG